MGVIFKLILITLSIFSAFAIIKLWEVPPVPQLEETWWGPRDPSKEETAIKPFKVVFPAHAVQDLKRRLKTARPFTPPLEPTHQYGLNTNLLTKIVNYWLDDYDFQGREAYLNQFPQFTVSVQGLRLHYIHVKPQQSGLKVVPILLLHGWPGSVREFYEVIPLLTRPSADRDFVFEVIVPSLPGYGFSEAAAKPGLGPAQMATVFKNLMKTLGFEQFYIQGGDWGALIVQQMAILYPEHILGVHSNMCFVNTPMSHVKLALGSWFPSLIVDKKFEHKVYPRTEIFQELVLEMGYMHLQATKPDTVGVALKDSPAGLAAYIIEKFVTWTNPRFRDVPDGGLKKKFTYTDLLDNVMIYWISGSIPTSMRLYAEAFNKAQMSLGLDAIPVKVPAACTRYANELAYTPNIILEDKYEKLVYVADYEDGGHFAAFELPQVFANDVYAAVERIRAANATA